MDNDPTRSFLALSAGTEVSHYRIINRIGAGGMGEVYLAEDTDLTRKAALKFLAPSLCHDRECRSRFVNEAQAAAKLNHPNIVTVYEVSEYRDRPFFAMEYVHGQSLKEYLSSDDRSVEDILSLASQVCEGLKAAHEAGIVHRDIKPSNILIDSKGRARIVDFGLALMRGAEGFTRDGSTAGTPAYMSPEQIRGEKVGALSDLFSLGVVLYQLLTGRLPFTGDYEAALIYSIANDDPLPLHEHRADIPQELEDLVFRLLEKDGTRRFQSADQVLKAIQGLRQEKPRLETSGRKANIIRVGILALILAAVVVAAQLVFNPFGPTEPTSKMVAVLPFVNLGSAEDEYFADGITDAITTHLTMFGDLGIISRASCMQYKGTDKALRDVGAELGATYLLTGTILWEKTETSNQVRINTALVKASDGSHVWANSYQRVADKIFVMQSDIAENVTRALNVAIGAENRKLLGRVPTDNLQAYDYFLRGNESFYRSWEQPDVQPALEMYQKAVDLDPDFAIAHAMLSRTHSSMFFEYYDPTDERRQLAFQAAEKSLDLQPDLVEGHLAMGYYYYHCERDYLGALREFDRGLQIQPNNADVYNAIACIYRRTGDFERAAENFVTALKLDPRSHLKAWDAGLTFSMMRMYDESEKYLRLTTSLNPQFALAHIYRAWQKIIRDGDTDMAQRMLAEASGKVDLRRSKYYWWLARVLERDYQSILDFIEPGSDTAAYHIECAQLNRLLNHTDRMRTCADSARVILERRLQAKPDDAVFTSSLGLAYAYLGQPQEAQSYGQWAVELLPTTRDAFDAVFLHVNLAEIFVVCGQYDDAAAQLEYMMTIPGFVSASYLKLDPLWQPLHGHPDFDSLVSESI